MLEDIDLNSIHDGRARELVRRLLNLLEDVMADLRAAQAEVGRLRDEVNRLKGEQGKPKIKPKKLPRRKDISSEKERHKAKEWSKSSKLDKITIDREEVLRVDRETLPPDAEFKGYEDVVVQDVVFRTDNVLYRKEKFHSPSEKKTFLAPMPAGYNGEFGPGIKALALAFYFGANMSEPKIAELFGNVGVSISNGQVSNLLIKEKDSFHAEKDAVYEAGLASSPWQLIDTTGTRVNGQNEHCHIVCNPLYTAYFTKPSNDRLTVVDVLRGGRPRQFLVNEEALGYVEEFGLAAVRRKQLLLLPHDDILDEASMLALLNEHLPGLGPIQQKRILDATAVAAYHAETEWPVVRLLTADGAPQFRVVTDDLALCWVHEGRHYKKLMALVPWHRKQLDGFLNRYWKCYHEFLAYRDQPTAEGAARLERKFDKVFSTVTGYDALDERIAKTRGKKDCLLMVLAHPEIPLHTNDVELGARGRVRKRDVSLGPRTREGVEAWDTFATLAATATKLEVSFYHYIHDRVSGAHQMPALADLIAQRAADLNLGASWDGT